MTHAMWVNGSHPAKKHHRHDVETLAAIKVHLRSVLTEMAPGYWSYEAPWTDTACAKKFGVPTHVVAGNRGKWFGLLYKPAPPVPEPPEPRSETLLGNVRAALLGDRLDSIEAKLDTLLALWAPKDGGAA